MLAHQGGWDELLWFSVPIVIVVLWVRWAERKARTRAARTRAARPGPTRDAAASTLPPHDHDH